MKRLQLLAVLSLIITLSHAYLISKIATSPIPMQFNAQGDANWSASPKNFFYFHLVFYLFINILTIGLSFVMTRLPIRWVNVPWKSYWVSTKNLEQECRITLSSYLCWAAIMVNTIGFLAQEMLAAIVGVDKLWLPFTLELDLFMIISLASVVVFLGSLFFRFWPPR